MPAKPSKVSVITERATPRALVTGLPVILGYDSTYATANEPRKYFTQTALAAAHGTTTKVADAGKLMFANRATAVVVIKPTVVAVPSENKGTAQTGTLANIPEPKAGTASVTIDSVAKTLVFVSDDPIGTVPANEVHVNPATKSYKTSTSITTSIIFTYSYFDYTKLKDALLKEADDIGPYTFLHVPNLPANADNLGTMKQVVTTGKNNDWFGVFHLPQSETVANAKKIRVQLANQHGLLIAHQDTANDVSAACVGMMSRARPWHTKAYRAILGLSTKFYDDAQIGDVETADTFEGEGINVLIRLAGSVVLSNERVSASYTATDINEEFYASRVLTRIALQQALEEEIDALYLDNDTIGLDEDGVAAGHAAITKVLEDFVADLAIKRDYAIVDPDINTIPSGQKKRRELGPYQVATKMRESSHLISVEVSQEVA